LLLLGFQIMGASLIGRRALRLQLTVIALLSPTVAVTASAQTAAMCERLATQFSPTIRISSSAVVPAGTFTPPGQQPGGGRGGGARAGGPPQGAGATTPTGRIGLGAAGLGLGHNGGRPNARFEELGAFCRVTASLMPTPTSDIRAELWLPLTGWNGNFVGSSPNGMGGNIPYGSMANALRDGFAVMGEDTGHRGNEPDWMNDHERRIDFGHRAVHEATVFAKALTASYYQRAPRYSYMRECGGASTAALAVVQNYPADYDGVVVGGFAAYWTRQTFSQMWPFAATHDTPASYVPPAKYPAIHRAVINACDAIDGVRDGVLEDPTRCNWQPSAMACSGTDALDCLTPPQVEAVRKVYEGPVNPRTGERMQSPLYRGSELEWELLLGPQPLGGVGPLIPFFRSFVFKDLAWDYRTRPLNFDSDVARANAPDIAVINAVKPDISQFVGRGGKLMLANGWSNAIVPPGHTVQYFEDVRATIGERATTQGVRLYMVPDMSECNGGAGTDTFDLFTAMQRWVEQDQAPGAIPASRVESDGRVSRTRPLCPYPQVATYNGSGSTDDAANFSCRVVPR
jgi:feruloyl esterase